MSTRLVLTLENKTIEIAKRYAREHNTTLSVLVEQYFKALDSEKINDKCKTASIHQQLAEVAALQASKADKSSLKKIMNWKFL